MRRYFARRPCRLPSAASRPPSTNRFFTRSTLRALIRIRTRHWLVEELEVRWKCELDRAIVDEEPLSDLGKRGFDSPAFLNTLRWSCTTATDLSLFQAPFRAGIKIDARPNP